MSFFENTRKPVGFGGKIMVAMMNLGHSPVAQVGASLFRACAGCQSAGLRLAEEAPISKGLLKKCPQGIVRGVDYSAVSVEKARI